MNEKEKKINIDISHNEIKALLTKNISNPNAAVMAEVIIKNLEKTSQGVKQLYKAFSGILPSSPYKVLDKVYVEIPSLNTWKFDSEKTKNSALCFKGCLKVEVTAIDLYRYDQLSIKYQAVNESGITVDINQEISINSVCGRCDNLIEDPDKPF